MEHLLTTYKKDVINQQLQLKRLANVCIDVFAMTAVLSRASRSLLREDATAEHEVRLVVVMAGCAFRSVCVGDSPIDPKS